MLVGSWRQTYLLLRDYMSIIGDMPTMVYSAIRNYTINVNTVIEILRI